MRLVVDMNLPPRWVDYLGTRGVQARHWSAVGDPRAPDAVVLQWARDNECVVFTHDLDFGTLLAMSHGVGPSVLQVRTQDVLPEAIGERVVQAIEQMKEALETGAIVTIDETTERVRVLPIHPPA